MWVKKILGERHVSMTKGLFFVSGIPGFPGAMTFSLAKDVSSGQSWVKVGMRMGAYGDYGRAVKDGGCS